MVIESTQQPVKRWRWRPRKNPLPEQKVAHKETAKRVSKASQDSSLSWEEELAAFEKRSNKSWILTLLVLLLGIALIGYGMYLKLHQADMDKQEQELTQIPHNPPAQQQPTDSTPAAPQQQQPAANGNVITNYFSFVNNGQFDDVTAMEDTSFKSLATLRTYFNNERLDIFSKNTIGGIRIESVTEISNDPALQRNPTAKAYDFHMVYTLKSDEKEYREPWRAYTIQKGSGTVINWFVYQWTGIAQSPFFQFNKFWIK